MHLGWQAAQPLGWFYRLEQERMRGSLCGWYIRSRIDRLDNGANYAIGLFAIIFLFSLAQGVR